MTTLLASSASSDTTMVLFAGVSILVLLFWYLATDKDRIKRNVGSGIVFLIATFSFFAIISPSSLLQVIQGEKELANAHNLQGGIEIVGGTAFIIEVKPNVDEETGEVIELTPSSMDTAKAILERRLNESGTLDAPVSVQGNRIEIQIPNIDPADAQALEKILTTTAKLTIHKMHPQSPRLAGLVAAGEETIPGYRAYPQEIKDEEGNIVGTRHVLVERRPGLTGREVARAWPDRTSNTQVYIELTSTGAKQMETFTRSLTAGRDQIVSILDGKVINNATLQAEVLSKNFVISGLDNLAECEELSKGLSNPMENDIEIIDKRTISATLGEATVSQGINAGLAGLALTVVFVLLYYRYSGIVAIIGLGLNVLILFGAMALFNASFTLPGIAGIILTIGVAVDANVLIYERMREELAAGKSVHASIKAAYEKAFSAIFDANITTLLTALILFWKATGSVKGFAVTLTMGIFGTLLASLLCTRVLFAWSEDKGILKKVKFMSLVPEKTIDFLGKRKIAFTLSAILIAAGIVTTATNGGSHLGIDFVGGSVTRFEIPAGQSVSRTQAQEILDGLKLEKGASAQIEQPANGNAFLTIKTSREDADSAVAAIRAGITGFDEKKEQSSALSPEANAGTDYAVEASQSEVSPTLGGEFLSNAIWALGLGIFCVLIYITLRFEFSFALGAFLALVHDILIVLGILVVTGQEFSLIHVGAFLTIAGYSINDTIVVFDRLREDLKIKSGNVADVMNAAISSTLSRTIITSVTTFVSVLVLYIFGGASLQAFSFTIMIGVIVGTYSSIFIASPIVYIFSKARGTDLRKQVMETELPNALNPEDV
ncbi:protein translocase subunit SecD [Rubritalea marina]|uniref:protein translocase subunit SecD n=1 Tax=Rubritalea marina TaxID=361055 RepID=UPI000399D5D4|nr:protein translocase subunit SecD [Rubritalea marina]